MVNLNHCSENVAVSRIMVTCNRIDQPRLCSAYDLRDIHRHLGVFANAFCHFPQRHFAELYASFLSCGGENVSEVAE